MGGCLEDPFERGMVSWGTGAELEPEELAFGALGTEGEEEEFPRPEEVLCIFIGPSR